MTNSSDEHPEGGEPEGSDAETPYSSGRNGSLEAEGLSEASSEAGAGRGDSGDDGPWYKEMDYGKRVVFPGLTILFLLVVLISFHKILLPFVFACAIVYLMEPIVVRIARSPADPDGLPRWLAVILVYLVFFGVVTLSAALIVPRFVTEVVRFAETVPQNVQKFREEKLPGINERIQGYLQAFVPAETPGERVHRVRDHVEAARKIAAARARALGAAREHVRRALELEWRWSIRSDGNRARTLEPRGPPVLFGMGAYAVHGRWSLDRPTGTPAFRIEEGDRGALEVYLQSPGVQLEKTGEDRWRLQAPEPTGSASTSGVEGLQGSFDLEERVDRILQSAITFSNEQLASVIEFAQHLVIGVLEGIIAIILTFMVAAFISIDLPRFMGFFRSLIPDELRAGYDELLSRVDEGLSGVIRGQLFICLINGIFTFIGLWIFDVKFSLLLSVIAGVLSIIPVFGTVISTIPICLIALTQSFMTSVLVLGWILLIHFIEGNILNPKIIGTSAEIHPVIVIFALLAGESTYGLVGAILGVPVASILLSLFKFARDKVWEDSEAAEPVPEKES